MPFSNSLCVRKVAGMTWQTEIEFTYDYKDEKIIVPKGFLTDFASVPRGLWNLIPPDGQYAQAAVLHDYLYQKHLFKRKTCDLIFLEAMKELKVSWIKRRLMFRAVRCFGWAAW